MKKVKKENTTIINIDAKGLSDINRLRIKARLPHGGLRIITEITKLHYATVKRFKSPVVIQAALDLINDYERGNKRMNNYVASKFKFKKGRAA